MLHLGYITSQKIKFSIKDFFSKCDQIRSYLWACNWRLVWVPLRSEFKPLTLIDYLAKERRSIPNSYYHSRVWTANLLHTGGTLSLWCSTDAYPEPCQTSKICENIFVQSFILDIWQDYEYVSVVGYITTLACKRLEIKVPSITMKIFVLSKKSLFSFWIKWNSTEVESVPVSQVLSHSQQHKSRAKFNFAWWVDIYCVSIKRKTLYKYLSSSSCSSCCVCVKRKALCNCLCFSSSSFVFLPADFGIVNRYSWF